MNILSLYKAFWGPWKFYRASLGFRIPYKGIKHNFEFPKEPGSYVFLPVLGVLRAGKVTQVLRKPSGNPPEMCSSQVQRIRELKILIDWLISNKLCQFYYPWGLFEWNPQITCWNGMQITWAHCISSFLLQSLTIWTLFILLVHS